MLSEHDKMLAGDYYQAGDSELVSLRMRARSLTRLFNQTTEIELDERTAILTDPVTM